MSRRGPAVKRRGAPPAASTIQMLDRYSSRSSDRDVTTNAMRRPSGDTWGSVTNRIRVRSSGTIPRSEEHTSELQSPYEPVCRLLLEKKKTPTYHASLPPRSAVCTHATRLHLKNIH